MGDPGGDRLPGLVGQLEPHRLPGLVLQDDGAMGNGAAGGDVTDATVDHVAAAQLAVDGEVEEGEVAQLIGELRADPDGPDLAQLQAPSGGASEQGEASGASLVKVWRASPNQPKQGAAPIAVDAAPRYAHLEASWALLL